MTESQFAERIAEIRARFSSKLAARIGETEAALAILAGDGLDSAHAVARTYRRFHNMCGIGTTIGFAATGQAARALVIILMAPFRDFRGLSSSELDQLKQGLLTLRSAARSEMQSTDTDQELSR